jgi:GDSL-like Lipase/Acylhydrolase family
MLGLPRALARPLARRMRAVNEAVDEVALRYGTVHLDVARDPATYERRYWSVDRLHPNERGHRLIACRFHSLLAASGFPVGPAPDPSHPARRPRGWRSSAGWPPGAPRGCSGGPGTSCLRWPPWPYANG